jgi:hypothetical protein
MSAAVMAQTETGQVTGKVTDPSGNAVAGATINIKSLDRASERNSTTNSVGIYVLPNLQPGAYEITITAKGIAVTTQKLTVTVGSRNTLNIGLEVAAANAPPDPKHVIEAADLSVDTATQTVSTVITQKQFRDFPSLSRNPY